MDIKQWEQLQLESVSKQTLYTVLETLTWDQILSTPAVVFKKRRGRDVRQ